MTLYYHPFSPWSQWQYRCPYSYSDPTARYSYEDCVQDCEAEGWASYECKPMCQPYKRPRPYYWDYPYSSPTAAAPVIRAGFKGVPRPHPDWQVLSIVGSGFMPSESITIEVRTFIRGEATTYLDRFDRQADANGVLREPERPVLCRRGVRNQSIEIIAYGAISGESNKVVLYC